MSTTLSASHPGVTYSPVNAWTSNQDGAIITSQTGALAIVEFQGVFVQVFGTISSFNPKPVSLYTMDDGVPLTFNASNFPISESSPNSTLFYQATPESGNHSLSISLQSGEQLILSSVVVYRPELDFMSTASPSIITLTPASLSSPISTSSTAPSLSKTSTPPSSICPKISVGDIVGGVIAATTVLVAVTFVFYHLYRRKKMAFVKGEAVSKSISSSPPTPEPFFIGVPFVGPSSTVAATQSHVFSTEPSPDPDPSSNSAVLGSAVLSISVVMATDGESAESSLMDEKDGPKSREQRTRTGHTTVPRTTGPPRSPTLLSAAHSGLPPSWTTSDSPPSYKTR